jgi:hypothetical protein
MLEHLNIKMNTSGICVINYLIAIKSEWEHQVPSSLDKNISISTPQLIQKIMWSFRYSWSS